MQRRGFTLVELLVVVGIIAILIAILVPTLGAARMRGYKVQTMTTMTQLSSAIDAYHLHFGAYPGPYAPADTTASSGAKISGSQNMLLGLSYGMLASQPSQQPGGPLPVPLQLPKPAAAASGMWVDMANPSGPVDYGTINPDGKPNQLAAYFTVTKNVISPEDIKTGPKNYFPAGLSLSTDSPGATNNTCKFPVVVDNYPDGMPILYFRRLPGVDLAPEPTATWGTNYSANVPYMLDENKEYVDKNATISATSGVKENQGGFGVFELSTAVSNTAGTGVRGGYVLISAGADRRYGETPGNSALTAKNPIYSDDLIQVGGE